MRSTLPIPLQAEALSAIRRLALAMARAPTSARSNAPRDLGRWLGSSTARELWRVEPPPTRAARDALALLSSQSAEQALRAANLRLLHDALGVHGWAHRGRFRDDLSTAGSSTALADAPLLPADQLGALLDALLLDVREVHEASPLLAASWLLVGMVSLLPFGAPSVGIGWIVARRLLSEDGVPFESAAVERELQRSSDGGLWSDHALAARAISGEPTAFATYAGRLADGAIAALGLERGGGDSLDDALLREAAERGRIDVRTAVTATGANRNTIKARLRRLVDRGELHAVGRGRGAHYRPAARS